MTAATASRSPVPREILPLIGAVVIGGLLAGLFAATPVLFITTPIMASALAVVAALGHRAPEWNRVAMGALAQLPDGQARVLLSDLLRRARAVSSPAHAAPLVSAACEAARQLSALEQHLAAFEAHGAGLEPSPRWRDAFERCRRGLDLLAGRLQDASAALSRWQAAQGAEAGESLGRLARELSEESRYQQEAAHDVAALLA
jgi:hypothetical protein